MALEDAAALEVLMADVKSGESVEARLKLFEQVRLPRCAMTQPLSNFSWGKKKDSYEKQILEKVKAPLPPLEAIGSQSPGGISTTLTTSTTRRRKHLSTKTRLVVFLMGS